LLTVIKNWKPGLGGTGRDLVGFVAGGGGFFGRRGALGVVG
jgi:hypothetical protein